MDYSLPDSSVHGIFQAGILKWVAISFSRGSSWPRDQTCFSCIDRQTLFRWATGKSSNRCGFKQTFTSAQRWAPFLVSPHFLAELFSYWSHSQVFPSLETPGHLLRTSGRQASTHNQRRRVCDPRFSARVIRSTLVRMLRSLPILEQTIVAKRTGAWVGLSQSILPSESTVVKSYD